MAKLRDQLSAEVEDLKRLRDELKLQAHLAKAEAKDLWDDLERKWPEVERNIKDFEHITAEAVTELGKATRGVLGHIRDGYERIRRQHR